MIDREEVLRLAKLSKLRFDDDEIEEISKKLSNILEYMKEIDEVNVDGVEPLYSVLEISGNTREDLVDNTVKKQDFLDNAPEKDDNFVIVSKIV